MLFSLFERLRGLLTPPPFWIPDLGARGEFLARRWYRRRGYHVVARNHRMGHGEIDLIVANGRDLIFVEVKARTAGQELSIDSVLSYEQERRLLGLAETYMAQFPHGSFGWRFDLMYIRFEAGKARQVHIGALA